MDIRISGHQVETGTALQQHATERLEDIIAKYFSRAISSHVTFGKASTNAFSCDIVTHVGKGLIVKGHGEAPDAHQAFDATMAKIEKQLRRYKRRLTDRHEQADHAAREDSAAYTVFAKDESDSQERRLSARHRLSPKPASISPRRA